MHVKKVLVRLIMVIKELGKNVYAFQTPNTFSIVKNTQETVRFFQDLRSVCDAMKYGEIVFDMQTLEFVSIDAVMYIIAIAYNISGLNPNIRFAILKPDKKRVKNFINQCGLNDFIKDSECDDCGDEYFVIRVGSQTDTQVANEISEFTRSKSSQIEANHVSMLYKMLIEMMNNSMEHAYTDIELKEIKDIWFVFIENSAKRLKFTFLDTGIGIPKSIFKKNRGNIEDIQRMFGNEQNKQLDDSFIFRALTGRIERENKENSNRGRGLPEIYGYYKNEHIFSNLCIISGDEKCKFYDSNRLKAKFEQLESELCGTLYYWEIKKGV